MKIDDVLSLVIKPGLALLPDNMDTPEARAMLLTIGLQESRFKERRQISGPAHGFFQFEINGAISGVMSHESTRDIIFETLSRLNVSYTDEEAYQAVVYNDALATVFARLLLWTIPKPLPTINSDPTESWDYYISGWQPGKPHRETWDDFRNYAIKSIKAV